MSNVIHMSIKECDAVINVIKHACDVYGRRIVALEGFDVRDEDEIKDLTKRIETLNYVKRKINSHANYQIMFATK